MVRHKNITKAYFATTPVYLSLTKELGHVRTAAGLCLKVPGPPVNSRNDFLVSRFGALAKMNCYL